MRFERGQRAAQRRLNKALAFLCLALVLAVVPFAAVAADTGQTGQSLDDVKRALESEKVHTQELKRKAQSLRKEAAAARQERIGAARAIQDHEVKVSALATELIVLSRREAGAVARLGENRVQAARVVMALQRMARNPPEALLAQPMGPGDTVRSAILLRAAVPGIEARVAGLRANLDDLAHTRDTILQRRSELGRTTDALKSERRRLDKLFVTKKSAIVSVESERKKAQKRLTTLAERAKNLQDLLARIEKDRKEQLKIKKKRKKKIALAPLKKVPSKSQASRPDMLAPSVPFSKARGTLPFPVVGKLVKRFGVKSDTGFRHKGVSVETLGQAQVIAPYDGKVVYADLFRGYGLLLILDHGEGYHSLLAGMSRVDGVLGQRVLAGEPVGVMGRDGAAKPELYVELRHNGQPINPMPWLAARQNKGKG